MNVGTRVRVLRLKKTADNEKIIEFLTEGSRLAFVCFLSYHEISLYEWLYLAKSSGFGVLSKKLTEIPQN